MSKTHLYLFVMLVVSVISMVATKEFGVYTMSMAAMVDNIPSFAWSGVLFGIAFSLIAVGLGKKTSPKENQKLCFLTILGSVIAFATLTPWGWALWQVFSLFRGQ